MVQKTAAPIRDPKAAPALAQTDFLKCLTGSPICKLVEDLKLEENLKKRGLNGALSVEVYCLKQGDRIDLEKVGLHIKDSLGNVTNLYFKKRKEEWEDVTEKSKDSEMISLLKNLNRQQGNQTWVERFFSRFQRPGMPALEMRGEGPLEIK